MHADQLTVRVLAARDRARVQLGQTAGCCGLVCRLLGYELAAAGVEVTLVIGSYRDAHHAWLETGGLICDPTVDQFDMDAPVITGAGNRAYRTVLRLPLSVGDAAGWRAQERERLTAPGRAYGSPERDRGALRLLAAPA